MPTSLMLSIFIQLSIDFVSDHYLINFLIFQVEVEEEDEEESEEEEEEEFEINEVCGVLQYHFSYILCYLKIAVTSAQMGAWKCNLSPFYNIMTDMSSNRPNNGRTEGVIR